MRILLRPWQTNAKALDVKGDDGTTLAWYDAWLVFCPAEEVRKVVGSVESLNFDLELVLVS